MSRDVRATVASILCSTERPEVFVTLSIPLDQLGLLVYGTPVTLTIPEVK